MIDIPKSNTRVYRVWHEIKRRCSDPKRKSYKDYGGRGISMTNKWETFRGFWEDMGESYEENLTIERLDVNKGYYKENCCWISKNLQARNKRKYSNNTLGIANMKIITNKGVPTLLARIQEPGTSRRIVKNYSLRKYGLEEAISLAEAWLKSKRNFYSYSESHGS